MPENKNNKLDELFSLSSLGINLVVSTVIGLGSGLLLDKWLLTAPAFTLTGFFLGTAAGFWQIIKEIRKLTPQKRQNPQKTQSDR